MAAARVESQPEIVRDLRRNVLEADARAGDALEPHPVQRQARQLAHLDLPLHQRVRVGVAVHAQQHESERTGTQIGAVRETAVVSGETEQLRGLRIQWHLGIRESKNPIFRKMFP